MHLRCIPGDVTAFPSLGTACVRVCFLQISCDRAPTTVLSSYVFSKGAIIYFIPHAQIILTFTHTKVMDHFFFSWGLREGRLTWEKYRLFQWLYLSSWQAVVSCRCKGNHTIVDICVFETTVKKDKISVVQGVWVTGLANDLCKVKTKPYVSTEVFLRNRWHEVFIIPQESPSLVLEKHQLWKSVEGPVWTPRMHPSYVLLF